ncbi:MAG: tRNA (N(6)-L-threonylcarbamoyladenosine(37)-C(2))-methylthiotransferase MtaB [Clostridiales bacterium]|nr:tRNA (N(6)-L-threonylcarbamoyladenosine(37)-C(2))-methylthiotransferase MtaB [Clostridiales bacterium]
MEITMTCGIYTLGCRVNQYESEAIAEQLAKAGILLLDASELCDAYIINTCTVTAESDRKARQFIRRAIKANPHAFILVTGCYAQTEADQIAKIEGVDYICGSRNKLSTVPALLTLHEKGGKPNKPIVCIPDNQDASFENMSIASFGRTRAYVKIQDGCENHCAYCIIPKARGPVCSKKPEDVLNEVSALAAAGYKEIVLTGIETAAYGQDLPGVSLSDIILMVDQIPGIERIRLGSLDPSLLRPSFTDQISRAAHLCSHFHLSLQSGCDQTLRRMRRKYTTDQVQRNIEYLQNKIPDLCLSADVIVGFPGETEEEFEATCAFVQRLRLLHGHIFSFSKRPGTEAAGLPEQVAETFKKERNQILQNICLTSQKEEIERRIGETVWVLCETIENGIAQGHTNNFIEVEWSQTSPITKGEIKKLQIQGYKLGKAIAKLLET